MKFRPTPFGLLTHRLNRLMRMTLPALLIIFTTILHPAAGPAGSLAWADDLAAVLQAKKLRHLGIPYANFVTSEKRGLDVELMQHFAAHLGVAYEFVETNWQNALVDLTGQMVKPAGEDITVTGSGPVRGDILATGFTVLPWRKKIVDFSDMTFPTGVWLISRADSAMQPIQPSGSIDGDIKATKSLLKGISVLALKDSCLDPDLYSLQGTGATVALFPQDRDLNEMIPSVMARAADTTLMDVPVALVALEQWPGEIKVLGPISQPQEMACAFPKTSPDLRKAFAEFYQKFKADGGYRNLVQKYYPSVFIFYPEFLSN